VNITIICSDPNHPVNEYLFRWIAANESEHVIDLVRSKKELTCGHILFLISCSEIIDTTARSKYKACLVLHASDLPRGRGWSPHIWQLISGAEQITLSLVEAEDAVDCGRLWHQIVFHVPKHVLWNEINSLLFAAEINLMDWAVETFHSAIPTPQLNEIKATYYPKRKAIDSRIDADCSISSQFDLIRVCDPDRYPAYFELHGYKYKIAIEKLEG
jgi:methionyl-tRNA formyltransferase